MSIKTTTTKKTAPIKPVSVLISLDQITLSDDFSFRTHGIDATHVADLASTIKNMDRALDPVLLWRAPAGTGQSSKLIVLDGEHRIAAYQAVNWQVGIPALILDGIGRRKALGAALKANSKRSLGLTQAERLDAAWRLVREPVEPRYKVKEVVYLTDVSVRTVKYMRSRLRVLIESDGEITGSWLRDRNDKQFENETEQLSDARREAEIDKWTCPVLFPPLYLFSAVICSN